MVNLKELSDRFESSFGRTPRIFSAPGRVNLIGEHTDYNDGFVLPMAIDRRTYVLAAKREDRRIVAVSEALGDRFEFHLDEPGPVRRGIWGDYLEGVARALMARGLALTGADLLIASDVPFGAGLSASAALEIAFGLAMATLGGAAHPDRVTLALAGQSAEHEYVGTRCGIMDQYVSALGRAEHALLIDCRSLVPKLVPFRSEEVVLVVCDTQVKHSLASSAYNERRRECEAGVLLLSSVYPSVKALRDVSLEELDQHRGQLPETIYRRSKHVVTENDRTLRAAESLAQGDFAAFGARMVESHRSLRDDYEVSCAELDLAVELALSTPNVFGARMTGGGFGGCTVSLCEEAASGELIQRVEEGFAAAFGARPRLFVTGACDGARVEHRSW